MRFALQPRFESQASIENRCVSDVLRMKLIVERVGDVDNARILFWWEKFLKPDIVAHAPDEVPAISRHLVELGADVGEHLNSHPKMNKFFPTWPETAKLCLHTCVPFC